MPRHPDNKFTSTTVDGTDILTPAPEQDNVPQPPGNVDKLPKDSGSKITVEITEGADL